MAEAGAVKSLPKDEAANETVEVTSALANVEGQDFFSDKQNNGMDKSSEISNMISVTESRRIADLQESTEKAKSEKEFTSPVASNRQDMDGASQSQQEPQSARSTRSNKSVRFNNDVTVQEIKHNEPEFPDFQAWHAQMAAGPEGDIPNDDDDDDDDETEDDDEIGYGDKNSGENEPALEASVANSDANATNDVEPTYHTQDDCQVPESPSSLLGNNNSDDDSIPETSINTDDESIRTTDNEADQSLEALDDSQAEHEQDVSATDISLSEEEEGVDSAFRRCIADLEEKIPGIIDSVSQLKPNTYSIAESKIITLELRLYNKQQTLMVRTGATAQPLDQWIRRHFTEIRKSVAQFATPKSASAMPFPSPMRPIPRIAKTGAPRLLTTQARSTSSTSLRRHNSETDSNSGPTSARSEQTFGIGRRPVQRSVPSKPTTPVSIPARPRMMK
jgi:hypothetical protein